jgi:hypothetical protein
MKLVRDETVRVAVVLMCAWSAAPTLLYVYKRTQNHKNNCHNGLLLFSAWLVKRVEKTNPKHLTRTF